jgi:glycosyltransferase involved in cell wall biosynthesis
MNPATARILEIGDHDYFKRQYPDRTTLLWTGRKPSLALEPSAYEDCTPLRLIRALSAARGGRYDVIVTYASARSAWHPRNWLRSLAHSPLRPVAALTRVFGVSLLRFQAPPVPLVALDMQDGFTISRAQLFLLDRAKLYFKRELPVDQWNVLHGSAHHDLPTTRIRRHPLWRRRLAKLRPISMPAGVIDVGEPAEIFSTKSSDVFFSGAVDLSSAVRVAGMKQLERLASRGLRVDLSAERLAQPDFYRRMARAWLAWSPAGIGWDCYRHYEAPQCLTVPVINYPTILRYDPLEDGIHAIYYPPEGDGLSAAIEAALLDKERLKRMALAGREHVRAHHIAPVFCERVLREALDSGD